MATILSNKDAEREAAQTWRWQRDHSWQPDADRTCLTSQTSQLRHPTR